MSHVLKNDALLKTARLFSVTARIFFLSIAALLLIIGIFGALSLILQGIVEVPPSFRLESQSDWWIVPILILAAATLWLASKFLKLLVEIIDTVAEGDPFVSVNADRLVAMGWFAAGTTGLTIVLERLGAFYDAAHNEPTSEFIIESGPEGLLLALVLFILARVFRHGTAMREDLEGTV